VLQCVAVCCSVLQRVAVRCSNGYTVCCSVLQCVAVCCSVLQYVAVCCSVLQRVALRAIQGGLTVFAMKDSFIFMPCCIRIHMCDMTHAYVTTLCVRIQ